jgi:hypothetical protein
MSHSLTRTLPDYDPPSVIIYIVWHPRVWLWSISWFDSTRSVSHIVLPPAVMGNIISIYLLLIGNCTSIRKCIYTWYFMCSGALQGTIYIYAAEMPQVEQYDDNSNLPSDGDGASKGRHRFYCECGKTFEIGVNPLDKLYQNRTQKKLHILVWTANTSGSIVLTNLAVWW